MAWSGPSRLLSQVFTFCSGLLLARLLTPDDFGLVAMVLVFSAFSQLLVDFGLAAALIQRRDISPIHYSTSYWFSVLLGVILALMMILASEPIALFYGRTEVKWICYAVAPTYIANSLSSAPKAMLSKGLMFKRLALVDFTVSIIAAISAIAAAIIWQNYWAIVAQAIIQSWLRTIFLNYLSPQKLTANFNLSALKELMSFSLSVFATKLLRQVALQLDKVLIGRFLDSQTLGLYSRAYQLMLFPLANVSRIVSGVMFPAFSEIQKDIFRIRSIYIKAIGAISVITFPMMLGMYFVAPYFVEFILGKQWVGMVPIMRVFCLVGLFTSIATITGSIYLALGRAKLQLKVNLLNQPLQVLALCVGVTYGLKGILIAYAISNLVTILITWMVAGKLINLSLGGIFKVLAPTFVCSLIMSFGMYVIDVYTPTYGAGLKLFLLILIGSIIYLTSLVVMKPSAYIDIQNILIHKLHAKIKGYKDA